MRWICFGGRRVGVLPAIDEEVIHLLPDNSDNLSLISCAKLLFVITTLVEQKRTPLLIWHSTNVFLNYARMIAGVLIRCTNLIFMSVSAWQS